MPGTRLSLSPKVLGGITLAIYLVASGCGGENKLGKKGQDRFTCGDQTVGVVPGDGTTPKDIYLCKGDTLTWVPNGHSFTVTFQKKSPFQGSPMVFQNIPNDTTTPVVSPPAIYTGSLVVYRYDMTVDNVAATDPQVVGGGAHSN